MLALLVVPAMPSVSFAQQPTGGIEGKVVDPAGSVVAGAAAGVVWLAARRARGDR